MERNISDNSQLHLEIEKIECYDCQCYDREDQHCKGTARYILRITGTTVQRMICERHRRMFVAGKGCPAHLGLTTVDWVEVNKLGGTQ